MSVHVRRRIAGALALGATAVVAGIVHANAPSYQYAPFSSTDTCISDRETTLTWTRAPLPGSYDFPGAAAACASLNGDGGSGASWRVPSVNELETLVDDVPFCEDDLTPGGGCTPKAIDGYAFPQTPAAEFWTSSTVGPASSATSAWTVDFSDGSSAPQQTGTGKANELVRCVTSWSSGTSPLSPPACPVH